MPDPNVPADCPFCRSNNLLQTAVIAQTDTAYLIDNVRFPGNYLIIPSTHAESPLELPDDWWKDVKALLRNVPGLPESYNLSFNFGQPAGQTVRHMHLWVVPRAGGQPASGMGLVTLINYRNEH